MKTKLEEFNTVLNMLQLFDQLLQNDKLTPAKITQYQTKLDELAKKFQYDESLGSQRYMLYELQSLIYFSEGHFNHGSKVLDEARNIMAPSDNFVTETATLFASRYENTTTQPVPVIGKHFSGKLEGWLALYTLRILVLPLVLIFDLMSIHSTRALDTSTSLGATVNNYIIAANIGDLIPLVATVFIWYIFFKRLTLARTAILGLEGYLIVYYGIFAIWLNSIIKSNNLTLDSDPVGQLGWGLILAVIWLLYWIFSKRVKATFVNA